MASVLVESKSLLRRRQPFRLWELNHRGKSYPGDHEAIIPVDLFEAVQLKLAENLNRWDTRRSRSDALLLGKIFDDRGNKMRPSHALQEGCALSLLCLERSGAGAER